MQLHVEQVCETYNNSGIKMSDKIVINNIDDVRALLKAWADWQRMGTGQNIGYPKSSAFIHADEGRETGTANCTNCIAEQIERTLCILKSISPLLFQCLLCEYLYELTNQQSANKLKCSEKTFKNKRKEAEYFIAGSFS